MKSIELFSGAGGLGIGASNAGFETELVIDWDKWACETIRINARAGVDPMLHWRVHEGDIRCFDYRELEEKIDLVTGGPPCQPFSLGGKHKAHLDERDMFPEAVRAIRELRPRAFMFENVKGLMRQTFANYLEYIRLQLRHPEVTLNDGETWSDHLARLENHETKGSSKGLH